MNRDILIQAVQKQMPAKRWEHTLGVMETAASLANLYGADAKKADLAAILHDYVKYWPVEKMREIIVEQGFPEQLLYYGKELWHAPVGAFIVSREFGIDDEEVLDAIRYHTSGREQMALLDKVVCLADYIEPGRDFSGVNHLRDLAKHSLEEALVAGFDSTIQFLIQQGKKIYPLTVHARNSLLDELKKNN